MKEMKKKTRKRLSKQIRGLVKKYGDNAVTTLVTTVVLAETAKSDTTAHTAAAQPKPDKKDKKQKTLSPSMVSA